jgi:hypothetical protein
MLPQTDNGKARSAGRSGGPSGCSATAFLAKNGGGIAVGMVATMVMLALYELASGHACAGTAALATASLSVHDTAVSRPTAAADSSADAARRSPVASSSPRPAPAAAPPAAGLPYHASMADGCYDVYVDLGTNIGVQIRKVFEPAHYPRALVGPRFEEYLGDAESRRHLTCAFGFEPNVHHEAALQAVQDAYNMQGWRTHILTRVGAGTTAAWADFRSDNDTAHMEWGGKVANMGTVTEATPGAVYIVDMTHFMRTVVLSRRIPTVQFASGAERPPRVVMKVDVEGMDSAVLAAMRASGVLCEVDYVYTEHVKVPAAAQLTEALRALGCPTLVERVDDETYLKDGVPLPVVSIGEAA